MIIIVAVTVETKSVMSNNIMIIVRIVFLCAYKRFKHSQVSITLDEHVKKLLWYLWHAVCHKYQIPGCSIINDPLPFRKGKPFTYFDL